MNLFKRFPAYRVVMPWHFQYMIDHHKKLTSFEISGNLDISSELVNRYLRSNGLRALKVEKKRKPPDKKLIAGVIVDFVMGNNIVETAIKFNINRFKVARILEEHYFSKRLNENTEVVTKKSKV